MKGWKRCPPPRNPFSNIHISAQNFRFCSMKSLDYFFLVIFSLLAIQIIQDIPCSLFADLLTQPRSWPCQSKHAKFDTFWPHTSPPFPGFRSNRSQIFRQVAPTYGTSSGISRMPWACVLLARHVRTLGQVKKCIYAEYDPGWIADISFFF